MTYYQEAFYYQYAFSKRLNFLDDETKLKNYDDFEMIKQE
jgi:hypothetical protein